MFNYFGEYVQLPWGVCLLPEEHVTLGSMFNYPGEYFQLPWGVFSITLGSIFNYPGEYFQLPWGVFSTTLRNGIKSKRFARGCLKKVKKTSRESAVQAQNDNPYNENSVLGTIRRICRICRICRIRRICRILRKRCQQLQVRPPFHTRRGPG